MRRIDLVRHAVQDGGHVGPHDPASRRPGGDDAGPEDEDGGDDKRDATRPPAGIPAPRVAVRR